MKFSKEQDLTFLRSAIDVSRRSRGHGNHPFGCVLVDGSGKVVLESENSYTTDKGPGHAETNLARKAATSFEEEYLRSCTLYTSVEPCCMCSGTAYWAGLGAVVFGMTEARLGQLTGDHPENLTMDLPCRTVFEAGRRPVEVRGPFPELEGEILKAHEGFWD
ncbi:nucleoside deaminase [Mesorhizobium sp. PAMC28654]|uniref:nucleoside deaminase n=1 Tax=Mesorhizobium sp. PAMC28654 TaxID=2880934 RepID=UPI001D0AEF94|nr:nucleoside deaminase [Mesorhizobium sp. PAMC28654]UDL91711.1 nucleoside deaminase [Mesorhizobium sp. PAMC28654]